MNEDRILTAYLGFTRGASPSRVWNVHFHSNWTTLQGCAVTGFDGYLSGESLEWSWTPVEGHVPFVAHVLDPVHGYKSSSFRRIVSIDPLRDNPHPLRIACVTRSDMGSRWGVYAEVYEVCYDACDPGDAATSALLVEMNEAALQYTEDFYRRVFS